MKINKTIFYIITTFILIISCTPKEPVSDLDTLRNNTNSKSYPSGQLDSTQAINAITTQKVQELLDLSLLYVNGNKNTSIDTAIFNQMKSYFYEPDSTTFKALFKDLDSNKVKTAKVHKLEVYKKVSKKDTLDFAKFVVEYTTKNQKTLAPIERNAQYLLVLPKKENNEFKFYFKDFYLSPEKDSTLLGVTK